MTPALPAAAIALAAVVFSVTAANAEDELRLLVYNTHGLPALLAGDDPASRFPRIGERARAFDLALLQEDFAHHERLVGALAAGTRIERGPQNRFPFCPFCSGSGLTLLSRLPDGWHIEVESFPFETCAGWIGGLNDCLATKGFQLARVRSPGGAGFFVMHTHLDAGRGEADREARRSQLAAMADAAEASADGEALLVAGDLNLDAEDAGDRALLDSFRSRLGLGDTGAQGRAENGWAVLDYILYRSGRTADFEILEAGEANGFEHEGVPLSDHPALFAWLRVHPRHATSGQSGGPSGPPAGRLSTAAPGQ